MGARIKNSSGGSKTTKKKARKPYKVRGDSASPEPTDAGRVARALLWVVGVCVWAFVVLSLVSFDAGDAPSDFVYPHNDPTHNWIGPVGAHAAYAMLKVLGWGVVPLALITAAWLVLEGIGRRVSHRWLRAIGTVLIAGSVAGLAMLIWPETGALPGLAGGTIGRALTSALLPGLSLGGTALILVGMLAVGLIVAFDKLLWQGPIWAYHALSPAAARTAAGAGAAAGVAGRAAARSGGGLLGGLASLTSNTRTVRIAVNDLGDEVDAEEADAIEVARASKTNSKKVPKAAKPKVRVAPVPAAAEDEYEEYDEYEEEDYEEDDDGAIAVADDDEAEEAAGAPQIFDRDALREKIAALPVRFSQANKSSATEDDLADLQNAEALEGYKFPGLDLLEEPEEDFNERLEELVREQAEALESALREYRIDGEVVDIESGPAITLYHVRLAPGTKVAAINAVTTDLARSLKAVNIRVVSNIVGRDTVGIEVPNPTRERVRLKELMGNRDRFAKMKLPMFLGKDASGDPLIADLAKMPHMLIAGTTGSGKSVCMNTIIMSFLYTKKPSELKLVLVDPKMVEMSQFKDIPHLMCPVVTEMSKAAAILEWAVTKMDERYELLADAGCRDISSYNSLEWEELVERLTPHGGQLSEGSLARIPRQLPYMVFIIDELADLMMTNKEVEGAIIRIAQKARAVGIHLILATQRPQANVVTGLIKSNMPCRVTFKVASAIDSRVVLDSKGGELLLGQGDMLFLDPASHELKRSQGTLVDDHEIRKVTKFLKEIAAPSFERSLVQLRATGDEERIFQSENHSSASLAAAQEDPLFDRAVEIVLETKRGSVSLLQRRLAIGYTRASRLIDLMGIAKIISDHKGSVARDVLISPEEWDEIKRMAEQEAAEQGIDLEGQQKLFEEESATETRGPEVHAAESDEDEQAEEPPFDVDAEDEDDEEYEEDEYEEEDDEEEDPDAEYEEDDEEEAEEDEYEEEDADEDDSEEWDEEDAEEEDTEEEDDADDEEEWDEEDEEGEWEEEEDDEDNRPDAA